MSDCGTGVAMATGLLIGLVVIVINDKPLRQLGRARREIQRIVRESFPTAEVFSFGDKYVHPDVWIAAPSDAHRDELQQDANLILDFVRYCFK